MKIHIRAIILSLFVSLFITQTSAGQLKTIKICWESELKPPYLAQDSQGELKGIAVDLLQQIMALQNIKYQHVVMPWKRCLISLQRGYVDLVPNASFKKSRTEFALFSKELYRTHLDFFYLKDKIPNAISLHEIEDFMPYKIGGVRGFNYDFYEGMIPIDTGAGNRQALIMKLQKGRIDFAILQREVFVSSNQDKQGFLAKFASIPAPQNNDRTFYVLAGRKQKNAAHLTSLINTGLAKLHDNGMYQQILDKYLK